MKTKFVINRLVGESVAVIFVICLLVIMGSALLINRFSENITLFLILGLFILLFWVVFTRGIYITIEGEHLEVTRFFLSGELTHLSEVISIHQRPIFGGFMTEVYMKIRNKDATFRNQGLINKPGLKESDLEELLNLIHSINPTIKIEQDLLSK